MLVRIAHWLSGHIGFGHSMRHFCLSEFGQNTVSLRGVGGGLGGLGADFGVHVHVNGDISMYSATVLHAFSSGWPVHILESNKFFPSRQKDCDAPFDTDVEHSHDCPPTLKPSPEQNEGLLIK